jgi:hypothetical protein
MTREFDVVVFGASGFTATAKGMAPNVSIDSWDWNSDYSEMTSSGAASATADASKIPLSNHSYGYNATTADMGVYNSESVDTDALARDEIEVVVQVNGKKRATVLLPVDASQALAEERALADEHVARFLEGQTVRKVIVVPGRLVNIVAN